MKYQIAIPSYKRSETIKNKTLKVLSDYNISPELVTIFVADEQELNDYQHSLKDTNYKNNIVISKPTLRASRNFIRSYYPEKTKLVNLDDDLSEICIAKNKKTLEPVADLEKDVFEKGFNLCKEHESNIWGIYAASNPFFMNKEKSVGLYYIIGSCWGHVVRHDSDLLLTLEDKEDFERTLQYYTKDNVVIRLDNITVKSKYYGEKGGMQETRTPERILKSAENLTQRYPELCSMYIRQTTGHAELKLKDKRKYKEENNNLNSFFG